jgi:integrase
MLVAPPRPVSGQVYLVQRRSGARWYVKWRDANGDHRKRLGRAWTGKGAPPEGYMRERQAKERLQEILVQARAGEASRRRLGVTFADAAHEWLRHGREERGLKPTTLNDYASALRSHLLPAFGKLALDAITPALIERRRSAWLRAGMTPRTANKQLAILHGIFKRAAKTYGLRVNAAAGVDRVRERYDSTRFDFYSPEEVWALVRAAASEQDAALYLTAAFTGLRRGELIALRWRDIDFAGDAIRVSGSYVNGHLSTPKSGRGRAVPMVSDVAAALARLGERSYSTADDALVFPGELGAHLDGSALRRRFVEARGRAGLRPLRFHDLRHTFGSLAINRASIVQVQHWMGHADVETTMRYLHHKSRTDDAVVLAAAFAVNRAGAAGIGLASAPTG